MSKMKNWMMEIEEFCDGYFYGGDSEFTVEEVSEFAEKVFCSVEAGKYAQEYIEKTLDAM